MAISISNQIENHRGVYVQAVGDGSTTAIVIKHNRPQRPNHSVSTVLAVTAGTNTGSHSGKGGFNCPASGTAVTVSSTTISGNTITVNTSAAITNGTTAHIVVLFDQQAGE